MEPIHASTPGPSTSQNATCFSFFKTDPGTGVAPGSDPGEEPELADRAEGEEAALSEGDVDPVLAMGGDDGTPPLAVAVDAIVGPRDFLCYLGF